MNTFIIVWVIVGSISTSKQNSSPVFIDNIATAEDCDYAAQSIREMHKYESMGKTYTHAKVRCIQVRKAKP